MSVPSKLVHEQVKAAIGFSFESFRLFFIFKNLHLTL